MTILGWICVLIALAVLVLWLAALAFIAAGLRAMPRLRVAESGPSDAEADLVSVIMPAHNEVSVIDEALTLLRASTYRQIEIIVVADRCTDGTVAVVNRHVEEDERVRLVETSECPEGWSGKCHAAWQGYQQSQGRWLLFTDADTLFDPALIQAAVALATRRSLDLLSLLGNLSGTKPFEKTAQPVAAMTLMTIFPIQKANRADPARRRPFANGQFMLFTRSGYETIGTHEQARAALLEDLYFALWAKKRGLRAGVTVAGRLFRVRMYDSQEAFINGWKRILTEATNRNIPRLQRIALRLHLQTLAGPCAAICCFVGSWMARIEGWGVWGLVAAVSLAALVAQIAALWLAYPLSGASRWSMWRYPWGCLACALLVRSAVDDLKTRRGIQWADLHYDVQDKVERQPLTAAIRDRLSSPSAADGATKKKGTGTD
ncbi:MAG: glycosyltransferase [Planctomycetes bacterium]|nr:glycosyltransferase [Planctomycetota bacterium]